MPVAKISGSSTPDAMKLEEGNDSLDTLIRQAVGKEPLFPVSRTADSPTQWIQLLHPFEQQDFPGWPLLAPIKVQMQKCDKCSREFCSPINYRRHIRVHRRSMKFLKEPKKYRDLLGAFWDKLSYDEAKEIMSFKDVKLEEVPGSTIVRHIAASLQKPIFLSLPQVYVKAGSVLVDIIQGRPYGLPISSQDLFGVLDDASERTFLCAGTAESLQKYVFDGEAGKIGVEMKNLIACTSFLVEQKLLKVWLADKEAEAWRCQKLLVEEEEAAQRRQAEILERKRQRKIRQKEQKARDQSNGLKIDVVELESIPSTETFSPQISPETDPIIADEYVVPLINPIQFSTTEEVFDIEARGGCSSDQSDSATGEQQHKVQGNGSHLFTARWQVAKSQKTSRNNLRSNQNGNVIKLEQTHKPREQRVNSGGKIWTKKPKPENNGEDVKSRVNNDAINQTQTAQSNYQLMIGSISVTVKNSQTKLQENDNTEITAKSVQNVKFWRPRHETSVQLADRSKSQTLEEDTTSGREINQTLLTENDQQSCDLNGNDTDGTNDSNVQAEDGVKTDQMPFSVDAAKAFLSQRWKEAISGDHVELVLTSAPEPPGQLNIQDEVRLKGQVAEIDSSINANVKKPKFRTKSEKSIKTKYILKQRAVY